MPFICRANAVLWRHDPERVEKWRTMLLAHGCRVSAREIAQRIGIIIRHQMVKGTPLCHLQSIIVFLRKIALWINGERSRWDLIYDELLDEEVDEVIAYLKSTSTVVGTVETAAPLEKEKVIKKEATKEDISKGKALFQGEQRFFNKGPSCISCHDVRNSSVFAGGSLAKELTTAYSRLGDISTRAILKKPAFAVMRQAYKDRDLTDAEIDALAAFLENVDKEQGNQEPTDYRFKMLRGALIGLGVLFIFYFAFWFVGKRKSGGVS